MEIIQNAVKCCHCKNTLESPVLLPCCTSICQKHTNAPNQTHYACVNCGLDHVIPDNGGFLINRAIEAIIQTNIHKFKLEFGKEYSEALKSCQKLESLLKELNLLKIDPHFFINNEIGAIKSEIDMHRENLKQAIDIQANELIQELEDYESRCKENAGSASFLANEIWLNLEKSSNQLNEWQNEMKNFEQDHEKWSKMKDDSEKEVNRLELELIKLKKELMMGQLSEFQEKPEFFFREHSYFIKSLNVSKILNAKLSNELLLLCEFSIDQEWELLYCARDHGFKSSDFHSKCDNISPTLTLILSTNGNIFGGYTKATWNGTSECKKDESAFIFSLVNKENMPIKMKMEGVETSKQDSIVANSSLGPIFGPGRDDDIMIASESNVNFHSFSNLGNVYKHPSYKCGSKEARNFLAGSYNFQVANIEVFKAKQNIKT